MNTKATSEADRAIVLHVAGKYSHITADYIEHRRGDVRHLLAALEKGNYERIRTLGHNMKGTAVAFGLREISHISRCREQAAADRRPEEVRRLAAELRDYVGCVEVVSD